MTLKEAMRVLLRERSDRHSFPTDIIGQAEQLGVEAMKRLQDMREDPRGIWVMPLRGETKD